MFEEILEEIGKIGIVPVVVLEDAADAVPLAQALQRGGLPCAEVTFRTEAAEEAIRRMTQACPDLLVGAGTVLTVEQARRARAAGARFIVSPGLNGHVVEYCVREGIPVIPGCATPSDVECAMGLGLSAVKFFPAQANGGIASIRAMAAPYSGIRFLPTGGVHAGNLNEYLAFPKVLACGGSWMVKKEWIRSGDFEAVEQAAAEAVYTMLGFELKHVGINCRGEEEALRTAEAFTDRFGFAKKDGNTSVFAGSYIEAMKTPYLGTNGHIAIGTCCIGRAVAYLERRGYTFDMETAKYKDGSLAAVYLTGEIGGFAVHLVQK